MHDFKIYSLLVVKNEADIIRASLLDACRWSDKIIVLDNGSTDVTWDIVQQLATEHPEIIPFGQYNGAFTIGLRARLYHTFKHEMRRGDWWCVRLDADEFFPGDVKQFLANIPRCYRTVKKVSTDYLLSKDDLSLLTGDFEQDKSIFHLALSEHRKERRFMRHCPFYLWPEKWRYPHPWGRVAPACIPVDHYQYRSVEQMQKRWETRRQAKADGCGTFKHENAQGWEGYLYENLPIDLEDLFHKATHVLKQGRNEIREIDGIVIKSFAVPRGFKRLIYSWFRTTKARRSYEYAALLGDQTPTPLAYKEIREHGLVSRTYYASRQSACPYTFKDLRDSAFPNREQHLRAIARFTAALHEQGIMHADYSQGNILFDDNDHIELVDLNRMHFGQHISIEQGIHNMQRLHLHDDAMFAILCDEYRCARIGQ